MHKSLHICLTFVVLALFSSVAMAQNGNVGIGTNAPHPSAILHMQDLDPLKQKGFKIPYSDTNAVYAFSNSFVPPQPIANGLLIFQKGAETFYYYDAKKAMWLPLSGLTGPTGPTGDTGLVGTHRTNRFVDKNAAWHWQSS